MGTYDGNGNRISDDTPIRFLYNGQFGVETDENGLYYMRARYYNTDIKRFMNWDVVDGSIENSQSLNKYSYVQGNPVSLTDPFGLCPEGGGTSEELQLSKHTLLDIAGCIPVIGCFFDLANAVSYAKEKNYTQALISTLSALPGLGDMAGSALKIGSKIVKGGKLAKSAEAAADVCKAVGAVGNVAANAVNFGTVASDAVKEYKSTGSLSAGTMFSIGASAVGLGISAKALSKTTLWQRAKDSIKRDAEFLWNNNGGYLDLSAFGGKSGSKAKLGNKLDYQFGKAGGNKHNIDRTNGLKAEMDKLGFADTAENRAYFEQYYNDVLNDSSNIVGVPQTASYTENGVTHYYTVTTRESFLMVKYGGAKVTTHWDGDRILTIKIGAGKQTRYNP